jgi:hypothetical protein
MNHRKLRIAWSVAWGIAALLLILFAVYTSRYQVVAGAWVSKSHFVHGMAFRQWIQVYVAQLNRKWPPHLHSNYIEHPDNTYAPERRWYLGRGIEPGSIAEVRVSLWL